MSEFKPRGRPCPMFCDRAWERIADSLKLSPEEVLICHSIMSNHCDRRIARLAGLSVRHVRRDIRRLYTHLDVHSHVGLAVRLEREHNDLFFDCCGPQNGEGLDGPLL